MHSFVHIIKNGKKRSRAEGADVMTWKLVVRASLRVCEIRLRIRNELLQPSCKCSTSWAVLIILMKSKIEELQKSIEGIVDECCAVDIGASQGLGCDNITAIIVELKN